MGSDSGASSPVPPPRWLPSARDPPHCGEEVDPNRIVGSPPDPVEGQPLELRPLTTGGAGAPDRCCTRERTSLPAAPTDSIFLCQPLDHPTVAGRPARRLGQLRVSLAAGRAGTLRENGPRRRRDRGRQAGRALPIEINTVLNRGHGRRYGQRCQRRHHRPSTPRRIRAASPPDLIGHLLRERSALNKLYDLAALAQLFFCLLRLGRLGVLTR